MRKLLTTCFKSLKALSLIVIMCFSMLNISSASHIVGGEIYYEWVSGNTYSVQLSFYRDCSGIAADSSQTIHYYSASCGQYGNFTVIQTGLPEQVSPICAASLSNSTCNGGTLFYGIEKYTYQGTVTLPGNCADWVIGFDECCRNAAITNLNSSGNMGSYFSAKLNNLDVPFNNSVAFGSIPYNVISNNVTTQLSWNTFDIDGDSLVYELVPAREFYNFNPVNLLYAPGYTYSQPFLSALPTNLNFSNGILDVTPNQLQVSVVCMKVSEYRGGFLVGEVYRDFQIAVVNSTNTLPALSGMNATSNYITNGCPGDTITFFVNGSDPDAGQNVLLTMNNPGAGAILNASAGTNPVGVFTWIPGPGDISASAYNFIITANDDNCPYYGTFSQAYQVYVNGCNTNDVWPGDANADGDANLYDLLLIGIAYNDNGPIRASANLTWTAQICADWTNNFTSGINHKHADTDGNGIVNLNDTLAIFQNYGLNHPLRLSNPNVTTVADLRVVASDDTVGLIHTVNFDISFDTPVDSIYGLAFRLYFDPAMIDVNSIVVTYPGSVFGTNGVDMIKIDRSQGMNGYVDIALTRINQNNISGTGPVARVTIVTTDNVSGKVSLSVVPYDISGITINESVVSLNGIGDVVVIDPNFVGVDEITLSRQLQVYPSPAHDQINFCFTGAQKVDYIKLYDVAGKEVMMIAEPASNSIIDIKGLSKGTYVLKASIAQNTIRKKIMIF